MNDTAADPQTPSDLEDGLPGGYVSQRLALGDGERLGFPDAPTATPTPPAEYITLPEDEPNEPVLEPDKDVWDDDEQP